MSTHTDFNTDTDQGQVATPMTVVIFGATGDLTHRKLLPALYENFRKGRLDAVRAIVGYARRDWADDDFRSRARDGIEQFAAGSFDEDLWRRFARLLAYQRGNLDEAGDYHALSARLQRLEGEEGDAAGEDSDTGDASGNAGRLYYLATAPRFYAPACRNLGAAGMAEESRGPRRVVIEK
ncbi:MAG: hypothetical protein GVY23_04070, partial [Spirochaetes bacterium]|nr:hypothetical protein [Spirochaetota bacterium]